MTANRIGLRRRATTGWLADRHPPRVEAALILGFYALYEASRGVVAGGRDAAVDHARTVASLERTLHAFGEPRIQALVGDVPGTLRVLGLAYLTLHLATTGALLLWLYRCRPSIFPRVRTALILASSLSLIGFVTFPTAPPRLAGLGLTDTVSGRAVDLNHGLVSALYNPYAAVPSMHAGYAFVVGAVLFRHAKSRPIRTAGVLYLPFVLLVIVATGNHFILDAVIGILVAAAGLLVTRSLQALPASVTVIGIAPDRTRLTELVEAA